MTIRNQALKRFASLIQHHSDQLVDLVQVETGKSRVDAAQETVTVPSAIDYYVDIASDLLEPHSREGAIPYLTQAREYREPRGVVGVITRWNFSQAS